MVVETNVLPYLALLMLSYIAGVLCFFSPCSLPVLPTYFAYTFKTKKKLMLHAAAFATGLILFFALLGMTATTFGNVLRAQSYFLSRIGGIILMVLGIAIILGKSIPFIRLKSPAHTVTGSFLLGLTFSFAWAPCIGPILAALFVLAASTTTVYTGGFLLVVYGLGLLTPLFAITFFLDHRFKQKGFFWKLMKGKEIPFRILSYEITVHTSNLMSGILFIVVGIFMALGYFSVLTSYFLTTVYQQKIFAFEEWLIGLF